jgi:hypothetical protein
MTVGQKLAEITGLKLFHNHMTFELVSNFFNVFESEEGVINCIKKQRKK